MTTAPPADGAADGLMLFDTPIFFFFLCVVVLGYWCLDFRNQNRFLLIAAACGLRAGMGARDCLVRSESGKCLYLLPVLTVLMVCRRLVAP
jgi:hypothetical protein